MTDRRSFLIGASTFLALARGRTLNLRINYARQPPVVSVISAQQFLAISISTSISD